jgi:hypothetical protein
VTTDLGGLAQEREKAARALLPIRMPDELTAAQRHQTRQRQGYGPEILCDP